jgi:hypothetical protein
MTTEATATQMGSTRNASEVRIGTIGNASESVDLSDFAEEPGGAWPAGWYPATIIAGYSTGRGKQFLTEDTLGRKGDSRNARVCFNLNGGSLGTRSTFESFNYREDDFTPARLAQIKEMRQEFKAVRGAWPGQADAQRSSLAIASFSQFTKALGMSLPRVDGRVNPIPFIGQAIDVRINIDDKGFNTITAFAASGTRTAKR